MAYLRMFWHVDFNTNQYQAVLLILRGAPAAPEISDFMPELSSDHRKSLWAAIRHKGRRAHDAD